MNICSSGYSLGIVLLALALSMMMWAYDKVKKNAKHDTLVGWSYLLIGLVILIAAVGIFLSNLCP